MFQVYNKMIQFVCVCVSIQWEGNNNIYIYTITYILYNSTYIYSFPDSFSLWLSQDIEYSFLCYTINPFVTYLFYV